jgi:hypothetical protein
MHSRATVVIPLHDGVVFVGALNGAELGRWLSEIAQTLDAITGGQLRVGGGGDERAVASWRDRSRELPRRAIRGVPETCAVWVVVFRCVSYVDSLFQSAVY